MRRRIVSAALAAIALACLGCNDQLPPVKCIGDTPPAISVRVFDAATGRPAACGAIGIAIDGAFSDSLHALFCESESDTLGAYMTSDFARLGEYTVLIQKPGYQNWTRSRVRVREGECGIVGAQLEAYLVRIGAPDVEIRP